MNTDIRSTRKAAAHDRTTTANIGIAESGAGRMNKGRESSIKHQLWRDRFLKEISLKNKSVFKTGFSGWADVFQMPRLQQYPGVSGHTIYAPILQKYLLNSLYEMARLYNL